MPHREFIDSAGRAWDVWTVLPERVERRRSTPPEGIRFNERRERDEYRVQLADEWATGWLCFQTGTQKRRLAPYPDNWTELDSSELERLCHEATTAPPPSRRAE
jgi:hypothetical protein